MGKTAHMETRDGEKAGYSECKEPLQGVIRPMRILVRSLKSDMAVCIMDELFV